MYVYIYIHMLHALAGILLIVASFCCFAARKTAHTHIRPNQKRECKNSAGEQNAGKYKNESQCVHCLSCTQERQYAEITNKSSNNKGTAAKGSTNTCTMPLLLSPSLLGIAYP